MVGVVEVQAGRHGGRSSASVGDLGKTPTCLYNVAEIEAFALFILVKGEGVFAFLL